MRGPKRRNAFLIYLSLLSVLLTPGIALSGDSARGEAEGRAGIGTESSRPLVIFLSDPSASDPDIQPLLGVISGPGPAADSPAPDLSPQLQEIGVLSIRNNDYYDDRLDIEGIFQCPGGTTYPSWSGCDPEDDRNYHWESSDTEFERILAGGFEPFLRLGGEWENAHHHHDFKGPRNSEEETNWIVAARRMTERYDDWNGSSGLLNFLDIWTEFPGEHFWDRDDSSFYRFWARAFRELKSDFPVLSIGGPGFAAGVSAAVAEGRENEAQGLLFELYRQGIRPDWLGWHVFSNHPEDYVEAARGYRDLSEGRGAFSGVPWAGTGFFSDMPMIVDAWGLSKLDFNDEGELIELGRLERNRLFNRARGAAVLSASWIAMQQTEVVGASLYRCGDPSSDPDADPADPQAQLGSAGLFFGDSEGTEKPSAQVFRLWSEITREYPRMLQTSTGGQDLGLWVLAGTDASGRTAILIANISEYTLYWRPDLRALSLPPGRTDSGSLLRVNDSSQGRQEELVETDTIEIAPEETQLLLLR